MVVPLKLGTNVWNRQVPQEFVIPLQNRFLEKNPGSVTGGSAIMRPGLKRLLEVGDGPIRGIYTEPGNFDESMFVASAQGIYEVAKDLTVTLRGTISGLDSAVIMTSTASIGTTPPFLFLTEGNFLYCYTDDGFAFGTLSLNAIGSIMSGDTIRVGDSYYEWTSGSVDSGTPDGSSGSPWLVSKATTNYVAFSNMLKAINGTGEPGITYTTSLTQNATVQGASIGARKMIVRAIDYGAEGNLIPTTVVVGADLSWGGATLSGGGLPTFFTVPLPNDEAPCSVATLASYVLVSVGAGQNENGRFYWILPGETFIRPLNFATAEQAPDATLTSRVVGDQIFFFGQNTTEVWFPTGDANDPFQRVQGQVFSRGVWGGTDVKIKENLIIVDPTGVVYNIGGGATRVSTPGVEQLIREAIITQASAQ